jgi:hypothetical protein
MELEWAALFKIFQSWGPSAISSVLVVVVLYLIKKVDASNKEEKERAENLKGCLEAKVRELRGDVTKALDEHGRRLSCIELEYVRREAFYRELGGWKDDINRLLSQVSELKNDIIELWRGKGQ